MTAHLVWATVTGLVAVAAAWAVRKGAARWRYAILLAALVRFAVPTGWVQAVGARLAPMVPVQTRTTQAVEDLRRLLLRPGPAADVGRVPGRGSGSAGAAVVWVWAAGTAACLWVWARRTAVRIGAIRAANAAETEALARACRSLGMRGALELRIASADMAPGALGWWRPAVVLPEGLSAQLSSAEIEAVLAHEVAHILRRDNLWAAVAHAVVSVFWFHPLVWWIERRMLEERETACDEMVVGIGTHPEVYLSGILKVCRMAFAGAEGYAGANGSNLEMRMERIMARNAARVSGGARALAGALVGVAVMLPLAGGYLKAQQQESQEKAGQARGFFEQGTAALSQKQYDAAERAFRQAHEADPENVRYFSGIVEARIEAGHGDEALALARDEAAKRPQNEELQMVLGNVAVRTGNYELAVATFTRIRNGMDGKSSRLGELYTRLGETYRRMGDLGQAITALKRAVEYQPEAPAPLATLALTLDTAGQTGEAEQAYRGVLKLDPKNGVALNNLAFLLASHGGDLDEAIEYANAAREALPKLTEVMDTLGYIYLARKQSDAAFGAFREAVLQAPGVKDYRSHLLLSIEQQRDRSAKAEELRVALREEPTAENQERVKKLLQ